MTRRLRQFYVARNNGREHHIPEMLLQLLKNLICQTQTGIIHSQQEALYLKRGAKTSLDDADSIDKLRDALKCEILRLNRDDDGIGCRQGIDRITPSEGLQSIKI